MDFEVFIVKGILEKIRGFDSEHENIFYGGLGCACHFLFKILQTLF